ncbi:MAG: hypothetical protein AB7U63_04810 [Porticoccaceae bacterium]
MVTTHKPPGQAARVPRKRKHMLPIPFEQFSFPVLSVDPEGKTKQIATSTLVRADENHFFLINAAHTLKNHGHKIIIALPERNFAELPSALMSKSKTEDLLDIAVTPLYGEFGDYFLGLPSVPLYENFPTEKASMYEERLTFFGFPASRCSIDKKREELKAPSITFTTMEIKVPKQKLLEKYSADQNLHILAEFHRRNVKDQECAPKVAPKPQGLSGGPVFRIYVKVNNETQQDTFKGGDFIGIANEYLANPAILKATKKSAILDFIKTYFPGIF